MASGVIPYSCLSHGFIYLLVSIVSVSTAVEWPATLPLTGGVSLASAAAVVPAAAASAFLSSDKPVSAPTQSR